MKHKQIIDNRPDIEKKIEETLNSLEGLNHAKTDPFFFSRLEERMNRTDVSSVFELIYNRLVPVRAAFYTVLLLFVLNTVSVIYYSASNESEMTDLEAFAEEYGLYTDEELYESLLEE